MTVGVTQLAGWGYCPNVHHLEYLTDISFAKQPASLFAIPAGYKPAK